MIYFNDWGIAALICSAFNLIISVFLISLKNKSRATLMLIFVFLGLFFLNLCYLGSALLPIQEGAYHRLFTGPAVFFALMGLIQFAYLFPRPYRNTERKIALYASILIACLFVGHFIFAILQSAPAFTFRGNIYNYSDKIGKPLSYLIVLYILWFIITMVRNIRGLEGQEKRAAKQMTVALVVPTLLPGIVNLLFNRDIITHGQFQQGFVLFTLLGYFAITIVFINNAVERTSFMTKIVGISLVTILLVVQGLTTVVGFLNEKNYDRIHDLIARNAASAVDRSKISDLEYVLSFPMNGKKLDKVETLHKRSGLDLSLDVHRQGLIKYIKSGVWSDQSRIIREGRVLKEKGAELLCWSFFVMDADKNRVYEVGFNYFSYRIFLNDTGAFIAGFTLLLILATLILFPIFFSRSLVRPLNVLLEGLGEVNLGNLEIKIPVMVQDEIGYLSNSFNNMVKGLLNSKNKLQDYADGLEEKVTERTKEVTQKMDEIQELKVQQDGDYFLTSLILKPLESQLNQSPAVKVTVHMDQYKKFEFRERASELGGDIVITDNLTLGGRVFTVVVNGDAMGKSMQGAGGAIVMGTVMKNILSRKQNAGVTPEFWLRETYDELNNIFLTFDGLMMVSAVIGLLEESTGILYYFNAEHPWSVLYRDGKAEFIETELMLRKLGSPAGLPFEVQKLQLKAGDVLFIGSDGKDDINLDPDAETRQVNEDEKLFLQTVEESGGVLEKIVNRTYNLGAVMDDFSLMHISFQGVVSDSRPSSELSDESRALYEEALTLLKNEERDTALAKLERALGLTPDFIEALEVAARIVFEDKNFEKARNFYVDLTEFQANSANHWFYLSICAKRLKNMDQAIQAGEKVRELQPHRIANLVNLADSYRAQGRLDDARELVGQVLEQDPGHTTAKKLDEALKAKEK